MEQVEGFVLKQPDLGTAVLFASVGLALMFVFFEERQQFAAVLVVTAVLEQRAPTARPTATPR